MAAGAAGLPGPYPPPDHDRSRSWLDPADWREHGDKYPGAEHVWLAFVSPSMSRRGEWKDAPHVSTSQVAATLASWMGLDWNVGHPQAGAPVR